MLGIAQKTAGLNNTATESFATYVHGIDWERQAPEAFVRVIEQALEHGANEIAMRLAAQGTALHPEHARLAAIAQVLAPAVIRPAPAFPTNSLADAQPWLREHAAQYRQQWVALAQGQLLAAAASLRELRVQLAGQDSLAPVLVMKVI